MRYFDISRLTRRALTPGPSGIDRVDLAYLQWLRSLGRVRYLVNGVGGFSEIDSSLGDAFGDDLLAAWGSSGSRMPEVRKLRERSCKVRAASKWLGRRIGLDRVTTVDDLLTLCSPENQGKLDLLDASASAFSYRVDPAWRNTPQEGTYFGISHSMLGRTAFLSALSNHSQLKRVFFIHDTIPCDYPQFCRPVEGHKHLLRLRNAFRYGTHLIVNSQYTAGRLEFWRKELGAKPLPVAIVPIGVDQGLVNYTGQMTSQSTSSKPTFIVLGTIEPRKNHRILLKVWQSFTETLPPEKIPRLILVGKRGWENDEIFQILEDPALQPHVEEMNAVSDECLWPLIRRARAMLFPSFVEGWGMPMIEALSLGLPIIASNIPAFDEAGEGIVEHLPTDDIEAWSRLILDYASADSPARSKQLKRLENYHPPTWEDHFSTILDWLGPQSLGLKKLPTSP